MRASTLRLCAGVSLLVAGLPSCARAADERTAATPPNKEAPAKAQAPVPQATPAPAPTATKTPGTAATVVNLKTIEGAMGKAVRSRAANEDMGHIVDVLVDGTGQIRAAVIDFGGFLGVGSRKVAVAWKTLDFTDSIPSGSVKVTLTRDQVRQAPEYKADEPVVVLEDAPPKEPAKAAASPPPPAGHNETAPTH